jgi:prolycopene isomerase
VAPSRAPLGAQSLGAFLPLTAEEAKDSAKVKRIIERTEEFLDTHYPEFRKNLIWGEYLVAHVLVGVAQTPDQVFDAKIENKCPWIDGLYFVGDTAKCWGAASDAAVHSALRAVSQFTGKNYLEILPEYKR